MNMPRHRHHDTIAFSLVEVVVALGLCSFSLVAVMGLFASGLKTSRESESRMNAANIAAKVIELRRIQPTNPTSLPNSKLTAVKWDQLAVPALNRAYGNAYPSDSATSYITAAGYITSRVEEAEYMATCRAGTNSLTGSEIAQVYLMITWPARMSPGASKPIQQHEVLTYIPIR